MFPPSCSTLFFPCKSISLPCPFSVSSLTPHRKAQNLRGEEALSRWVENSEYQIRSLTWQVSDPRQRAGMSLTQSHTALEEQNQSSDSLIPKLGLFPKSRGGLQRLCWMRKSSVIFRGSHILSKSWCCMCFRAQDSQQPSSQEAPWGVCPQRIHSVLCPEALLCSEACTCTHLGAVTRFWSRVPPGAVEAWPWLLSSCMSHSGFLAVLRGRTGTSVPGMFPGPAVAHSPCWHRSLASGSSRQLSLTLQVGANH